MAILMRGGLYEDFDPSKLKPREWAVVLGNDPGSRDGRTVYLCFGSGVVKRIATHEDMADIILNATEDIQEEFMGMFNEILAEMRRLKTDVEGYKNAAVAKAGEAANSAKAAKASEGAGALSAQAASSSASTASTKATEAAGSASAAATSETEAAAQAATAKAFKDAADAAQTAAKASETNAKDSETKAKASETAAAQSAAAAAQAGANAAASAEEAADSAARATEKASEAMASAEAARQYSGKPPKPQNGTWLIWDAADGDYKDSGIKSVLSIVKSYPSAAAMEADKESMEEGDLVIIASDAADEDNSKLFVHNGADWTYLSDLSGLQGVGIANVEKAAGDGSPGSTDVYVITLTNGETYPFSVYNGLDGTGTGDMQKSTYDASGRSRDVFDYVDEGLSEKADLKNGKVPSAQLPEMDYVPNAEKGEAAGVATLGSDGKVPPAQLPEMDYEPAGSVSKHNASTTAHADIRGDVATRFGALSRVATSGSYDDLSDKPTIPTMPASLPANGGNADTVDGFHASQSCVANGIVVRDADKYIQLDTSNDEESTVSQILTTNGADNSLRKVSLDWLKRSMGVSYINGGSCSISRYTGQSGYYRVLRFKVTGWTAAPSIFSVSRRGYKLRKFILAFTDAQIPNLKFFHATPDYYSPESTDALLHLAKAGDGIWEIYIQCVSNGSYMIYGNLSTLSIYDVSFDSVRVQSLPEGCVSPTEVAYIP